MDWPLKTILPVPYSPFVVDMDASENSTGMILSHHGDPHKLHLWAIFIQIFSMENVSYCASGQNLCFPNNSLSEFEFLLSSSHSCIQRIITLYCHTAHTMLLSV